MKCLLVFCVCLSIALALPKKQLFEDKAEACTEDKCVSPDCRCSNSKAPLDLDNTPQLISLTFDEAVVENLYSEYWSTILDRKNPDGTQIGATFFVPHEYTDYSIINTLYNAGFEIAVHSITKTALQEYWRNADKDTLVEEFKGQKEILAKFANISTEEIIGVRTPQLQINGNVSIQAYIESELSYDSSLPTLRANPLFPYTLDFLSTQQCVAVSNCPNEEFPGFWVLPLVNLQGDGKECNSIGDCNEIGTAEDIRTWLDTEIKNIKLSKAPLTIRISSLFFSQIDGAMEGFTGFLDDLAEQKDVFLVSQKQILDWTKNPVSIDEFKTDTTPKNAACNKISCRLEKGESDIRYMNSCVACPDVYPWLGNPEGKA